MSPNGTATVSSDSLEGTTDILVMVGGKSVRVSIEVASRKRYESLLDARGLNALGEMNEAAVAVIATESVGGGTAVAEDTAKKRMKWFVAVVGAVALLSTIAGVVALRAGTRKRMLRDKRNLGAQPPAPSVPSAPRLASENQHDLPNPPMPIAHGNVPDSALPVVGGDVPLPPAPPAALREPVGSAPHPLPQGPQAAPQQRKICPTCGAHYDAKAVFCGKDGTSLLFMN